MEDAQDSYEFEEDVIEENVFVGNMEIGLDRHKNQENA